MENEGVPLSTIMRFLVWCLMIGLGTWGVMTKKRRDQEALLKKHEEEVRKEVEAERKRRSEEGSLP